MTDRSHRSPITYPPGYNRADVEKAFARMRTQADAQRLPRLKLAALVTGSIAVRILRRAVAVVAPAVMRYKRASDRLVARIEGKDRHADE